MKVLNYALLSAGNRIAKRIVSPFWIRQRQLERTQHWSSEKLQSLQLELLRRIVTYAYRYVPYYQEKYRKLGVCPEDIQSLDDVKKLPLTTKQDVLAAGDSIISSRYPKWKRRAARTGGSTGTPLIIWRNWNSIGNEHAFVRRQYGWGGLGLSDRYAILMSKVVAKPGTANPKLYHYDPIMKEMLLSTYHLSEENIIAYADIVRRYDIKALVGYPSALGYFAKVCLDNGINLPLKAAFTTSEILTPDVRSTIMKAFQCRVCDFYGSAERVCYIHTCEKDSYHVIPEYGYTELIPVSKDDPCKCRVVSTGFWNFAMPLIRYNTGDCVTLADEPCSCGRAYQVVDSVDGRDGDVIKTPSGRKLGVTLIIQLLYVICGTRLIAESQMIQDAIDHVTIEYVPLPGFSHGELTAFEQLVREYMPEELAFDLKEVEQCRRTESGKLRPLVSLVQ